MSAGACFIFLGYGMAVGLSLSENRTSSPRETDYPAIEENSLSEQLHFIAVNEKAGHKSAMGQI